MQSREEKKTENAKQKNSFCSIKINDFKEGVVCVRLEFHFVLWGYRKDIFRNSPLCSDAHPFQYKFLRRTVANIVKAASNRSISALKLTRVFISRVSSFISTESVQNLISNINKMFCPGK